MRYVLNALTGNFDLVDSAGNVIASDVSYDNNLSGLSATNVQDAIDEIAEQKTYIHTFNNTTDWGSPSGGYYTFTVTEAVHEAGTNPVLQIYEEVAGELEIVTVDRLSVEPNGDVGVRVLSSPDLRFAGKLYIASKVAGSTGGGGPSVWGTITGTLSNQTDLQIELDNKANVIHDHNTDNINGNANQLMGFDTSGEGISVPGSSIQSNSGLGWFSDAIISGSSGWDSFQPRGLNIEPTENAPSSTTVLNNNFIAIDNDNSGHDIGINGRAVVVNNNNVNHNGLSDTGEIVFSEDYFQIGNSVDPIDVQRITGHNVSGTINNNVTLSGLSGYNFNPVLQPGSLVGNGTFFTVFNDNASMNTSINGYTSFLGNPYIQNVNNNYNIMGLSLFPNIDNFSGNAGYTGINSSGNFGNFGSGQLVGIEINQNANNVNFSSGLRVNMNNVNVFPGTEASITIQDLFYQANEPGTQQNSVTIEYIGGGTAGSEIVTNPSTYEFIVQIEDGVSTAQNIKDALDVFIEFTTLCSVTITGISSNPQTIQGPTNLTGGENPGEKFAADLVGNVRIDGSLSFTGALSIGALNAYHGRNIMNGTGNPESIHMLIGGMNLGDNETVTLGDMFSINTAALMNIGENSSITTGLVGLSALGLPAVLYMQSGSSVDRVVGATFAVSLDEAATGGTAQNLELCRALTIPNGVTTVDRLVGYKFDLPLGDPATLTYGVYSSPDCHNYLNGNLLIGGTPLSDDTVTNASVGLELKSTTKALVMSRMNETERNSLTAIDGMVIYNTNTNKFQGYANGSWEDLH